MNRPEGRPPRPVQTKDARGEASKAGVFVGVDEGRAEVAEFRSLRGLAERTKGAPEPQLVGHRQNDDGVVGAEVDSGQGDALWPEMAGRAALDTDRGDDRAGGTARSQRGEVKLIVTRPPGFPVG